MSNNLKIELFHAFHAAERMFEAMEDLKDVVSAKKDGSYDTYKLTPEVIKMIQRCANNHNMSIVDNFRHRCHLASLRIEKGNHPATKNALNTVLEERDAERDLGYSCVTVVGTKAYLYFIRKTGKRLIKAFAMMKNEIQIRRPSDVIVSRIQRCIKTEKFIEDLLTRTNDALQVVEDWKNSYRGNLPYDKEMMQAYYGCE